MQASISITRLYSLLSEKVGKETAENLTTYIEGKVTSEIDAKVEHLATKEDIERTAKEIERNSKELLKWMIVLFIPLYLSIFGLIVTLLLKR